MSTEIEKRTNGSLALIKDTRKLLIERLSTALELYEEENVKFPAKRQYLLDWLLDSFYRLVKASSEDKISSVINDPTFWTLLIGLLKPTGQQQHEKDDSSLGRKRIHQSLMISKPILPILHTYFKYRLASNVELDGKVSILLQLLCGELEESLQQSMLKNVQDLLAALNKNAARFTEETAKVLLVWYEGQNSSNALKIFNVLVPLICSFINDIDKEELKTRLVSEILLSGEVVKEISVQVKMENFTIVQQLEHMGSELFFNYYCQFAKSYLPMEDFRSCTVILFCKLFEQSKANVAVSLVKSISIAGLASDQSDKAWAIFSRAISDKITCSLDHFELMAAIIDVDICLLDEQLQNMLGQVKALDEPSKSFIQTLSNHLAKVRQLEKLVSLLVAHLKIKIDDLKFLRHVLRPLFKTVHQKSLISIASLLSLEGDNDISIVNSLLILQVLASVNPTAVASKLELVDQKIESTNTSDLVRSECFSLVEILILNRATFINPEKYILHSNSHAGLSGALFSSGLVGEPSSILLNDTEAAIKYLPAIIKSNFFKTLGIELIPDEILKCAQFWEFVPSIDELLDQFPRMSEKIILYMPNDLVLYPETAMRYLGQVTKDARLMKRLLQNEQPLPVKFDSKLGKKIFLTGNVDVQEQLVRRGLVDAKLINLHFTEIMKCSPLPVSLIRAIIETSNDIFIQKAATHVKERLLTKDPIDSTSLNQDDQDALYRIAATVVKSKPSYFELYKDFSCWKFNVALRHEKIDNVNIESFADAVKEYLYNSGVTLSAIDVMLFIRTSSDIGQVLSLEMKELKEEEEDKDKLLLMIELLDCLMTQPSLETQSQVCPFVDELIITKMLDTIKPTFKVLRLLSHRLLCGGRNINALQEQNTFDDLLRLICKLTKEKEMVLSDFCSILSNLIKFHWNQLMVRRPLFMSILKSIILKVQEAPRKVNRLIYEFAAVRQSDQHYYIPPLILAYVHNVSLDAQVRNSMTPSICMLIRIMDQQVSNLKVTGKINEKYFQPDPLDRLMCMTETDDAKVILKSLIKTYNDEYKFTGKA